MKLADAMYYAAQNLTTDASRLHQAMDEYHKFISYEYHKEEPTIPEIVDEHFDEMLGEEPVNNDFEMALAEMIDKAQTSVVEPLVIAAQWKDELIKLAKSEEPVSKEWIKELQDKLDSLSKEDFEKVWAKYSRYGKEGSVDYDKLSAILEDALSKETKESWNKRLGKEEPVSENLEEAADKYTKEQYPWQNGYEKWISHNQTFNSKRNCRNCKQRRKG